MQSRQGDPIGNAVRATRRGPDGLTHIKPQAVQEVKNPCPVCHNTAYLQQDWRPETGYDRRMRQFKCLQGHEHYTVPRHARNVLEPPQ